MNQFSQIKSHNICSVYAVPFCLFGLMRYIMANPPCTNTLTSNKPDFQNLEPFLLITFWKWGGGESDVPPSLFPNRIVNKICFPQDPF